MRYFISDVHGEYELFVSLLQKIRFSDSDEMYICGDIVDKGESSVRLARLIATYPNIFCIIGNHEHAFLKYYRSLLEQSPDDFDEVLGKLREYFPEDGHLLDWDTVDWIDNLPTYIENEDFICVHAGVPIGEDGLLVPLCDVSVEQLVNDRRFKEPNVRHSSQKCVFFGHTQTDCICGEPKIIGYPRRGVKNPTSIKDFCKVHLDTGSWSNGVLGCFCADTLKVVYVKKETAVR